MRKFSTNTFVFAVMSVMGWVSAPAAAAEITALCRGGPVSMEVRTMDLVGDVDVSIWFKQWTGPKTSISADGSHLAPGQCSLLFLALPSSWGTLFNYRTRTENLYWQTYMSQTSDHHTEGRISSAWVRLNPLSTDPNLQFMPPISPTPDVGSIFDPNTMWRLRVNRADGRTNVITVERL